MENDRLNILYYEITSRNNPVTFYFVALQKASVKHCE